MKYQQELSCAIEAVRQASKLCQRVQRSLATEDATQKSDASPVTIADLGAQALISRELLQHFPADPLVAEEDSAILRHNQLMKDKVLAQLNGIDETALFAALEHGNDTGGANKRFWTLDPIDGTKGFLRKAQYAIALALIEDGEVVLGVLGCPNLLYDSDDEQSGGTVFYAVHGEGSYALSLASGTTTAIHVDALFDSRQARFCESVETAHSDQSMTQAISKLLGITQAPYRIDSQCKYGVLARGDVAIYLRLMPKKSYAENIWDHAAGAIVVTEAGGRVSDFHGKALDFSQGQKLSQNTGVVATNGILHDAVLSAIATVMLA